MIELKKITLCPKLEKIAKQITVGGGGVLLTHMCCTIVRVELFSSDESSYIRFTRYFGAKLMRIV